MSASLPHQIAILGLGYVGLPLAVGFGRSVPTIGFDVDVSRVTELKDGHDRNNDVSSNALAEAGLHLTMEAEDLESADFFIVTVPTPVDSAKRPDLQPLIAATRTVGNAIRHRFESGKGVGLPPVVVYESTVYPGCTEEVCVPILEEAAGGPAGERFVVGYSPERINPGDDEHTLERVIKVVSGQDVETTERVAVAYSQVAKAGVHRTSNIKTAEACKVIENVQRDLNIALMNELSMLFHRLGLDTEEVLKAAGTKWNFLPFKPGLVGGHCIPVDPYYLTYRAEQADYHPEVILAGRRVNDGMGRYVAHETVKLLAQAGALGASTRVLVLGVTFKEDVPDLRNSRALDLIAELREYSIVVDVYDPLVTALQAEKEGLDLVANPFAARQGSYDAIVLATPHREFRERSGEEYCRLFDANGTKGVVVDVKGVLRDVFQGSSRVLSWSL